MSLASIFIVRCPLDGDGAVGYYAARGDNGRILGSVVNGEAKFTGDNLTDQTTMKLEYFIDDEFAMIRMKEWCREYLGRIDVDFINRDKIMPRMIQPPSKLRM